MNENNNNNNKGNKLGRQVDYYNRLVSLNETRRQANAFCDDSWQNLKTNNPNKIKYASISI